MRGLRPRVLVLRLCWGRHGKVGAGRATQHSQASRQPCASWHGVGLSLQGVRCGRVRVRVLTAFASSTTCPVAFSSMMRPWRGEWG